MSHALSNFGLPRRLAQDSERLISLLHTIAETDPRKAAILECYTKGFQAVFIVLTALSSSGLAVSLLIKKYTMDDNHQSSP
jgi:hypothetical protein